VLVIEFVTRQAVEHRADRGGRHHGGAFLGHMAMIGPVFARRGLVTLGTAAAAAAATATTAATAVIFLAALTRCGLVALATGGSIARIGSGFGRSLGALFHILAGCGLGAVFLATLAATATAAAATTAAAVTAFTVASLGAILRLLALGFAGERSLILGFRSIGGFLGDRTLAFGLQFGTMDLPRLPRLAALEPVIRRHQAGICGDDHLHHIPSLDIAETFALVVEQVDDDLGGHGDGDLR